MSYNVARLRAVNGDGEFAVATSDTRIFVRARPCGMPGKTVLDVYETQPELDDVILFFEEALRLARTVRGDFV